MQLPDDFRTTGVNRVCTVPKGGDMDCPTRRWCGKQAIAEATSNLYRAEPPRVFSWCAEHDPRVPGNEAYLNLLLNREDRYATST